MRKLVAPAGQVPTLPQVERRKEGRVERRAGSVAPQPVREFSLPVRFAPETPPEIAADGIRFLGQVFGVFLIFELPGRLLMLDQHAAHERIIFERLMARAPALQELLFPLSFDASEEEEERLVAAREELLDMGVAVRRAGARAFEVTALSAELRPLAEERLVEILREVGGKEWQYGLRASAACRLAIKEGDRVDPVTAHELCARALQSRCRAAPTAGRSGMSSPRRASCVSSIVPCRR